MKYSLLSVCLLAIALFTAQAWWETGHMLVAQVAKQELLKKSQNVYSRAENITLFIAGLTKNLSDSFIEAAVWMDDIKSDPWDIFYNWHFINRPYNPLGLSIPAIDPMNSVYAVTEALRVLNNTKTRGLTTLTKSIYMRVLLHVMGDMHQPLHDASLFNRTYPNGDLGGNLEKVFVQSENKTYPLHSFWDSVAFKVPNDMPRPLQPANISIIEQLAQSFTDEFPRSALQDKLNEKNVTKWTIDCFRDAVESAYNPLRADMVIDEPYQTQAYATIRRNIALGGYRIADLLFDVLSREVPSNEAPSFVASKLLQYI